jgi:hypothetical protein
MVKRARWAVLHTVVFHVQDRGTKMQICRAQKMLVGLKCIAFLLHEEFKNGHGVPLPRPFAFR